MQKTIRFPARVECGDCDGSGGKGGAAGLRPCTGCGGKGEIKVQQGFFSLSKRCPSCSGSGKIVGEPCPACKGAGSVEKEREYTVSIPAGTEDGATRRVAGEGERGLHGGPSGDLNVLVRVKPHPIFRREGDLVVCDVPVSITQAALGAVVQVPTLDGRVEMRVPPGTQSGTLFRLRGKGVGGRPGGKGNDRGDAHVRVVVEVPTNLTPRQQELMNELAASLGEAQLPGLRSFGAKVKETLG